MTNADHKKQLELVLTKEEARQIYAQGQDAVAFKLLDWRYGFQGNGILKQPA